MTGIFNPSTNTGGGGSYDNAKSIYRIRQLILQDGVTIQPNSAVTAYGDIPLYEGYQPVGIPQLAIWDATSNGFGWGYASLGHSFIDFSSNKAYVLIHNTHTSSAINVQVIIFVLYMLNTSATNFKDNFDIQTITLLDNYSLTASEAKTNQIDCPIRAGWYPSLISEIIIDNNVSSGGGTNCSMVNLYGQFIDHTTNKIHVYVRNLSPNPAKFRVRARILWVRDM